MDKKAAENKLLSRLHRNGILDIFEFDALARTYLGRGEELADVYQEDLVALIADEFGMSLIIQYDESGNCSVYHEDYAE